MKHLIYKWALILVVGSLSNTLALPQSTNQYHIQTDEGPERYFRYQTDNGQYRKEKRLKDGTVIGTDAWIDASGVLRQNDYIADSAGYRILKSKTVYVGKDQPIDDALKSSKNYPSTGSISPDHQFSYLSKTNSPGSNYIPPTSRKWLYYDHPSTPSNFIRSQFQSQGNVYAERKNYRNPTFSPLVTEKHGFANSLYPTDHIPSIRLEPPYKRVQPLIKYPVATVGPITNAGLDSVREIWLSSTPSPIISVTYPTKETTFPSSYPTHLSTLNTDFLPPLAKPTDVPGEVDNYIDSIASTTLHPESFANKEHSRYQPLYTRPSTLNLHSLRHSSDYTVNNPNADNGSKSVRYEGIATNGNSFQYYLPRQYHEEVNDGAQHQAGSFGYIDPFGIRRVIYYDSTPEHGFLHRKNNRYVGFNATPYDPKPIE